MDGYAAWAAAKFRAWVRLFVKRLLNFILLLVTTFIAIGIGAQDRRTPTDPWQLESYRPVIGVQFCENPVLTRSMPFDGTTEECKAEFDRLFVKCTTDLPYVNLPSEFRNKGEQAAGVTLLFECISSHYIGGDTLKEFESSNPPLEASSESVHPDKQ